MVAGWSRFTQATARLLAATAAPAQMNMSGTMRMQEAQRDPRQLRAHVQVQQQFLNPDLRQVEHQHHPGVDRAMPAKQHEVGAVKLGSAVQNLAETHGAKVGFHAGSLANGLVALGRILAQVEKPMPCASYRGVHAIFANK